MRSNLSANPANSGKFVVFLYPQSFWPQSTFCRQEYLGINR